MFGCSEGGFLEGGLLHGHLHIAAVDILEEATGHAILHLTEAETALGIGEETALFGTRDGHVEQATLLLHLAGTVVGHHRGEELLLHADDKDGVELEAFGGVHGHEGHLGGVVLLGVVLVGEQGHIAEEVGEHHGLVALFLT